MAMYAPIDRDNYPQELALKVEEMAWLEKELLEYSGRYQIGLERRVMGEKWEPEYKYHVVKWELTGWPMTKEKTRRVLLETSDPDQVIATLKMLLSIEREPR